MARRPPGLFLGVRTYSLTPSPDETATRFELTEVFSGLMLPMIAARLPDFGPIFERYAADLKAEAEVTVRRIRSTEHQTRPWHSSAFSKAVGRREDSVDRIVAVRQEEIWDVDAAQRYDTPGVGMFAPEVLGPTVDRLAEYAGNGRALEFAIGTGRVAVPLAERGVPVTGIELSGPMIDQLRGKVDEERIPVVVGTWPPAHRGSTRWSTSFSTRSPT